MTDTDIRIYNPDELGAPLGQYTHVTRVKASEFLFIAGMLSADPEAILQAGTNLSMVRLAAEAERWLKKPVIAINAATYWFALRDYGINDTKDGYGRLMSDFAELPDDYAAVAAE